MVSATGNPLVDMVSWFAEGVKPSEYDARYDYYLRTQVRGETGVDPKVTETDLEKMVKKLEAGESVLADRLHGLEKVLRKKEEESLEGDSEEEVTAMEYAMRKALREANKDK
jgi:hypothetical protein